MIIRRIPLDALQQGVYDILTTNLTEEDAIPIYDDVPDAAVCPYITLGAFTNKFGGSKDVDISDVSLQIHIWSEYSGKTEVNTIANNVANVLTSWIIVLSAEGFNVIEQGIDMFEAFPEETTGYHGVLTFVARVQNIGPP
jgi:hypothetical protein